MEKDHVVTPNEQWQMDQIQEALDRRLQEQVNVRKQSKEGATGREE